MSLLFRLFSLRVTLWAPLSGVQVVIRTSAATGLSQLFLVKINALGEAASNGGDPSRVQLIIVEFVDLAMAVSGSYELEMKQL